MLNPFIRLRLLTYFYYLSFFAQLQRKRHSESGIRDLMPKRTPAMLALEEDALSAFAALVESIPHGGSDGSPSPQAVVASARRYSKIQSFSGRHPVYKGLSSKLAGHVERRPSENAVPETMEVAAAAALLEVGGGGDGSAAAETSFPWGAHISATTEEETVPERMTKPNDKINPMRLAARTVRPSLH